MQGGHTEDTLRPGLELLALENPSMSDDAILPILLALCAGGSTSAVKALKHIYVYFHRAMEKDIMPALEHLESSGINITLSYNPPWMGMPYFPQEGLRTHATEMDHTLKCFSSWNL
jgi:hypothetical protein